MASIGLCFGGGKHADDAAEQREKNRHGKAADHHGQQKLQRDDTETTHGAAQQEYQGFQWRPAGQGGKGFTAKAVKKKMKS